jgi:phage gp29-like protein
MAKASKSPQTLGLLLNKANKSLYKKSKEIPYNTNPLRYFTIERAIQDIEMYELGVFANVKLAFDRISTHDPLISVILEKRLGALKQMDYQVLTVDDSPAANAQKLAVEDYLNSFDNLQEILAEMEMASFLGYSVHEKLMQGKEIIGLQNVPLEFIYKKEGMFYYCDRGAFGQAGGIPMDPDTIVVRHVEYPITPSLNILYTRKRENDINHDEFLENYSIPSTFVVMPENVPAGQEQDYVEAAKGIINDSRGVLPYGSLVTQVRTTEDNNQVFLSQLDKLNEQITLRVTGGLLTTLSLPQGIGSGSTDTHQDTFKSIIQADATNISEIITKELVNNFLSIHYPNQEKLAYFKLDSMDKKQVLANIILLKNAGFEFDPQYISEVFGVKVKDTTPQI